MSKELSPLEALNRLYSFYDLPSRNIVAYLNEQENLSTYNEIIRTALKEKEQQDSVLKILKEIIEFAQMLPSIVPNKDNGFDVMSAVRINIQRDIENRERELLRQWVLETCFPKELKALKIIKEKEIDIWLLKNCDYDNYCRIRTMALETNVENMVDSDKPAILLPTKEEFDLLKEVKCQLG